VLRALHDWPAFYFVVGLLGAVEIGWTVLAFVIRHLLPEERGRRIGRVVVGTVFRHYFRLTRACGVLDVDASALDAIDPDEPMIIAPNHPSGLDALILISRLENLNCIMKASMLDNLFLGSGARLAGYIRNDGARRMFRLATEDLKRGGQLIIFPEATRTRAAPVNAFKGGFAAMARLASVPIQTVIVETDTPYLSKGWSALRIPPQLPMRYRVRLGERFRVGADENLTSFVDNLRDYFVAELDGVALGALWDAPRATEHDEASEPARGDVERGARGDANVLPPLTSSRWG
jgi:1-acyl-sn-glycerol-3-phosphate acyltransferase